MGAVKQWGLELQTRPEYAEGWDAQRAGTPRSGVPESYVGDARAAWEHGHDEAYWDTQMEPEL